MNRSRLCSTLGALLLLGALMPLYGGPVTTTEGMGTLVDFDEYPEVHDFSSETVSVYTHETFEITMAKPGEIVTTGQLLYGWDRSGYFTDAIFSVAGGGSGDVPAIEFTLAGGAVSAIGIRLSAAQGYYHSSVILEIFGANDERLGITEIEGTNGVPITEPGTSKLNQLPDVTATWAGVFRGFDLGEGHSEIVRFRITGASILMDDLQFGGLALIDPEPEAIPEPATFLLCGAALAALSITARKRSKATA